MFVAVEPAFVEDLALEPLRAAHDEVHAALVGGSGPEMVQLRRELGGGAVREGGGQWHGLILPC